MIKDGIGGANTQTGLKFEERVDFLTLIQNVNGYSVRKSDKKAGSDVFFDGTLVARVFKKYDFYRFLEEKGIEWKSLISKQLLPDDALLVIIRKTLFIIEVKYQQVAGSVDEKLQTCDFKRIQYQKLVQPLGLKVEYIYVLNDWFKDSSYKDVLDYILSVHCYYTFNELPFGMVGIINGKRQSPIDIMFNNGHVFITAI
jgi:hypothetical protein